MSGEPFRHAKIRHREAGCLVRSIESSELLMELFLLDSGVFNGGRVARGVEPLFSSPVIS